jgi:hypothetical protein
MVLENAMSQFAQSNRIQIVRFESAGSTHAYVCVSNRNASAMKRFVRSMGQGANTVNSAAARQPIGSQVNSQ